MAEEAGFLRRWSRLKQADREGAAQGAEPGAPAALSPEDPIKDLPPLDSLGKDSDFSPFMRPGVPDALRNEALRKLWGSDPVYANLDGLLEYGEDFAAPFRMAGVVATVYRVLEGMPDPAGPATPVPEPGEISAVPAPEPGVTVETEAATIPVEPDRAQEID